MSKSGVSVCVSDYVCVCVCSRKVVPLAVWVPRHACVCVSVWKWCGNG